MLPLRATALRPAWMFELKWDGFRAVLSTEDGLRVRSRRGWMTPVPPELRKLRAGWTARTPARPRRCQSVPVFFQNVSQFPS